MDGPAPLFVVGTGRCGSTMLSDLLREHDRVLSLSEFFCFTTDFGGRIAQAFSPEPVDSAQLWEIIAGARQHALTVLNHDATHFRLLPRRAWNDWVANLFLAWPMFISVQGFRHFHGPHHRHLGEQGDGNRALWHTHDAEGQPTPEWRYPKTAAQLFFKLLRRAAVLTGLFWIARGLVGGCLYGLSPIAHGMRMLLWGTVFALLSRYGLWLEFAIYWVLPYCTWHAAAQYTRLVCEHSAVRSEDPRYARTRTTVPGPLARFFVLPRNIGYHLEHHWYPSVPFYNLPALHARLAGRPEFRAHAQCTRSVLASLRQCITWKAAGVLRALPARSTR